VNDSVVDLEVGECADPRSCFHSMNQMVDFKTVNEKRRWRTESTGRRSMPQIPLCESKSEIEILAKLDKLEKGTYLTTKLLYCGEVHTSY